MKRPRPSCSTRTRWEALTSTRSALNSLAPGGSKGRTVVVLPEVVVWEWAEHAHRLAEDVNSKVRKVSRELGPLAHDTLLPNPMKVDIDEVVRMYLEYIDSVPGVVIWEIESLDTWKGAVRDQVLVRGTAERKKDVKTGAADTVVATVVADLIDHFETVVVWTSDKRLTTRCRDVGAEVVAQYSEILRLLLLTMPASEVLRAKSEEALEQSVRQDLAEGLLVFLTYEGCNLTNMPAAEWRDPVQVDVEIEDVYGISLELEEAFHGDSDDQVVVVANVAGSARVSLLSWYVDHNGDLVSDPDTFEADFEVPIVGEWSHAKSVEGVAEAQIALDQALSHAEFDYEPSAACTLTVRW